MGLALISSLIPVALKTVVTLVDKIKGGGSGAEKKPLAINLVKLLFDALGKSTPGLGLPTSDSEIGKLVEDMVGALNAEGKLQGHATVVEGLDTGTLLVCASMLEDKARTIRAHVAASAAAVK